MDTQAFFAKPRQVELSKNTVLTAGQGSLSLAVDGQTAWSARLEDIRHSERLAFTVQIVTRGGDVRTVKASGPERLAAAVLLLDLCGVSWVRRDPVVRWVKLGIGTAGSCLALFALMLLPMKMGSMAVEQYRPLLDFFGWPAWVLAAILIGLTFLPALQAGVKSCRPSPPRLLTHVMAAGHSPLREVEAHWRDERAESERKAEYMPVVWLAAGLWAITLPVMTVGQIQKPEPNGAAIIAGMTVVVSGLCCLMYLSFRHEAAKPRPGMTARDGKALVETPSGKVEGKVAEKSLSWKEKGRTKSVSLTGYTLSSIE